MMTGAEFATLKNIEDNTNEIRRIIEASKWLEVPLDILEENKKLEKELQLKDKVIEEMAKSISSNDSDLCEYIDLTIKCNRDNIKSCAFCIKQYFINKVKGE